MNVTLWIRYANFHRKTHPRSATAWERFAYKLDPAALACTAIVCALVCICFCHSLFTIVDVSASCGIGRSGPATKESHPVSDNSKFRFRKELTHGINHEDDVVLADKASGSDGSGDEDEDEDEELSGESESEKDIVISGSEDEDDDALDTLHNIVNGLETGTKRKGEDDSELNREATTKKRKRLLRDVAESGIENEFGGAVAGMQLFVTIITLCLLLNHRGIKAQSR